MADLTRHAALEEHRRVVVDELELLEDLDTLLVVGKELEVLVRYREFEVRDILLEDFLSMNDEILSVV